ncbi:hypothetical protein SORBI_3004G065650 [Sorghum bicolor]|uniref:Secreted protein n=1 Tax=Sorghum bicolor TaxID=4558 RepID=A0A1Z5RL74_SORBI|nr:hypothetical protein SORBI_3004G065650 [Sorghum bicolor]OQU84494.1 hypothetical protein SORBI_3004G065650 [Sorghum bicolor]
MSHFLIALFDFLLVCHTFNINNLPFCLEHHMFVLVSIVLCIEDCSFARTNVVSVHNVFEIMIVIPSRSVKIFRSRTKKRHL